MIEVIDLHKRYLGVDVLRGVSLQIRQGEVSVLIGPSGGGKSTLLRTINGLESFDQGQIIVDDVELSSGKVDEGRARRVRQRVGMVFQQFNLFPHLTVLENITAAPRLVSRLPREEADELAVGLLRRVGLHELRDRRPSSLSGGQQQRVAIARSLAMNPSAILFDEPTSALDPHSTADVVAVVADLATSGQTMLIVTHGLSFARAVAHTVHLMHAGQVIESAPVAQFFEEPTQQVTRNFLAAAR